MTESKTKITWKTVRRKLSELKPYEKNPRDLTEQGLKDLDKSISKFGLAEPIVINTDNVICGGHGRYVTLKQQGVKECDCYLPSRKLSPKEFEELNIRLNKNQAGVFNFDILANEFEVNDLLDYGFLNYELGIGDINDVSEHWKDMPEFNQENIKPYKTLLVHFENEKHINEFAKKLGQTINIKTKYIFYPKQVREKYSQL